LYDKQKAQTELHNQVINTLLSESSSFCDAGSTEASCSVDSFDGCWVSIDESLLFSCSESSTGISLASSIETSLESSIGTSLASAGSAISLEVCSFTDSSKFSAGSAFSSVSFSGSSSFFSWCPLVPAATPNTLHQNRKFLTIIIKSYCYLAW
jgi:hypothetical protein